MRCQKAVGYAGQYQKQDGQNPDEPRRNLAQFFMSHVLHCWSFPLQVAFLQADNSRVFDYHEKHSPKVVQTRPKKTFLYIGSVPIDQRNLDHNKPNGGNSGHNKTATLQPVNPLETT